MVLWSQSILWHKNQAGMIGLGECFYAQTLWNLEKSDTLGGYGCYQPQTLCWILSEWVHLPALLQALQYCIFSWCHGALTGGSNWVEFDSTSMTLTGWEMPLCVSRGRSTETVYNWAQYVQLTVPQLKAQVSEFLSLRGLVRSNRIDAGVQTQALLPPIPRVSQGKFLKGK